MSTTIGQCAANYINGAWTLTIADASGGRQIPLTDPVQTALSQLLTALQNTTEPAPNLPNDGGVDGTPPASSGAAPTP